jgi:GDPmannose 4,6-dehydratase
MLEAMRRVRPKARFYQASSSEMFGKVQEIPQTETTRFYPRSPYGVAKLYGHWITINYRESYDLFACSGISFNHESPRRGPEFVTRKISMAVAAIKKGRQRVLKLGNLNARRDWGYVKDYVRAMWLMLQKPNPVDYVLSTGHAHSVRDFVESAFRVVDMEIEWRGDGMDEKGYCDDRLVVEVAPEFYRPLEVDLLVGSSSRARTNLGWFPQFSFGELVETMVKSDMEAE